MKFRTAYIFRWTSHLKNDNQKEGGLLVKIRITGTESDIQQFVDDMEHHYDVISVSQFYKNDRKVQKSQEGRVYIEANLKRTEA